MRILKKIMFGVLLLFFIGMMLFSAYQIYDILSEYKEGEEIYEQIEDGFKVKATLPKETETSTVEEVMQETESDTDKTTIEESLTEETVTEEENILAADYSKYESEEKLVLLTVPLDYVLTPQYAFDFENLLKMNADVKGWISIEGTNIDYPVVQAADNDYYLRRAIDHTQNNAGSIFIECLVETPFEQKNTIIYGHNQKNKKMFHELMYYQEKSYYEKNPLIEVYLPDGRHQIYEVYSAYLTESSSPTYQIYFDRNESFAEYVAYTKQQSLYETNASVTGNDTIITLSTCTNEEDTERMIVHARLFTQLIQ